MGESDPASVSQCQAQARALTSSSGTCSWSPAPGRSGATRPSRWRAGRSLLYEIGCALYFVGWEYFYRGFLTISLYRPLGIHAIFVGNIPFVLMHAGKPFPEALGSIVAGVALGLFALRARSFWYGWLLHALIAASMDLLAIQQRIAAG